MKKTILTLFMMIAMTGIVSAASTFNISSSDTIEGTEGISAMTSTFINVTNCTITGSSANTGDTAAFVLLGTAAGSTNATLAVDTTTFSDANDWTFTGNCYENNSAGNVSAITTISSVIVDNSDPTCILTGITAGEHYEIEGSTITVTGVNASSSATLYIGGTIYDMTKGTVAASQIYTYLLDNVNDGVYEIYAITSDGTDTTTCDTVSGVQLDSNKGGSTLAKIKAATPISDSSNKNAAIGIVVLLMIYFWKKK